MSSYPLKPLDWRSSHLGGPLFSKDIFPSVFDYEDGLLVLLDLHGD